MLQEPIIKIGEIDLEKIKKDLNERYHKKFAGKDYPRQFPLQGAFDEDWDGAKGNTLHLRNDEQEYTIRLYKDYEYIYSIIDTYTLHRTRIMNMPRATAYGWHYDLTPRIHIPITTNSACMFILNDIIYRMPADGSVYWVDTTLEHTAINASREPFSRIHIVGNTLMSKEEALSLKGRL
jgi:hypothetical protein